MTTQSRINETRERTKLILDELLNNHKVIYDLLNTMDKTTKEYKALRRIMVSNSLAYIHLTGLV